MWTRVRRRVSDAILVLWLVATLVFVLLHLAPGDPLSASLSDPRISPAARTHWREVYAFDQPILVQYGRYVLAIARGDLGFSFSQSRPVFDALSEALPYSVLLMSLALCLSIGLGALLGTWQAVRTRSLAARLSGSVASALTATPDVWLALMLLALFGAQLGWLPLSGRCDVVLCGVEQGWTAIADLLRHVALPALTLTLSLTAMFARVQRVALAETLHDDVMRTARAKGVAPLMALRHHGVRRALRPLITSVGLSLPMIVGGAVLVERVFGWPGMGSLLVNAVSMRDYPLVTATAMAGCVMVLAGGAATDVVSDWLDPRRVGVNV